MTQTIKTLEGMCLNVHLTYYLTYYVLITALLTKLAQCVVPSPLHTVVTAYLSTW